MAGELTYGEHAREQMRDRGVSERDVEFALNRQVRTTPGELGTLWIWGRSASGGKLLKVCVRLPEKKHVITVAWAD